MWIESIKKFYQLNVTEGPALENFSQITAHFRGLHLNQKITYGFYLLGPIFMLIEHNPGDAWLSICGLIFLDIASPVATGLG